GSDLAADLHDDVPGRLPPLVWLHEVLNVAASTRKFCRQRPVPLSEVLTKLLTSQVRAAVANNNELEHRYASGLPIVCWLRRRPSDRHLCGDYTPATMDGALLWWSLLCAAAAVNVAAWAGRCYATCSVRGPWFETVRGGWLV